MARIVSGRSVECRERERADLGQGLATQNPPDANGWCNILPPIPTAGGGTTWGKDTDYSATTPSPSPTWIDQQELTASLNNPEALAGAQIVWTVKGRDEGVHQWHWAALDGIELKVTYRSPGNTRPLSGCTTIRETQPPSTYLPGAADGIHAARGYDWLDNMWAPWGGGGSTSAPADDAFGNNSGTSGNLGPQGDSNDCALVNIEATKSAPIKFHVSGMIYAPSAALALTGYSNDASWASGGLMARQVTALRWKLAGFTAAVGDGPVYHGPRIVTISVCKQSSTSCTGSDVYLRAKVEIDDDSGASPGKAVKIDSWIRNPQ